MSVTQLYALMEPHGTRHHVAVKTSDNVKRRVQRIKHLTKAHVTAFVIKLINARKGFPGTKILVHARIHPNLMESYALKISVQMVYHATLRTVVALMNVLNKNVETRLEEIVLAKIQLIQSQFVTKKNALP